MKSSNPGAISAPRQDAATTACAEKPRDRTAQNVQTRRIFCISGSAIAIRSTDSRRLQSIRFWTRGGAGLPAPSRRVRPHSGGLVSHRDRCLPGTHQSH